jgi:hypothetical protein
VSVCHASAPKGLCTLSPALDAFKTGEPLMDVAGELIAAVDSPDEAVVTN